MNLSQLLNATTPEEITPLIRDFCASFSKAEPQYVPVMPEGKPGYCFPNVKAKVEADGGEIIYGRTIWLSEAIIEAEWHTVWQKGDAVVDITAKRDGEKRILFMRTGEVWDGSTVWPNIRRLLTNDADLRRLIAMQAVIERSATRLSDGRIQYDLSSALRRFLPNAQPQKYRAGRNQPCPCGSGLKFKKCCGRK